MTNVVIDYESYYDKDINVVDQGVPNYVRDTDAYIVSLEIEGQAAMCGTLKELEEICTNLAADATVRPVAANSNFDQKLWEKYNKPFVLPWHCVLDQSVFHQFPRNLGGLAKCVLGRPVDKSMRDKMKGVRYETMPEAEQIKVQEYCLNDSVVEAECFRKLGPMSAFEERVALHTRLQSRRGVFVDTELVDHDKTRIEDMRFEAFKAIPWHAHAKPLSYASLVKFCDSNSIPVPKSTAKTDEACEELMTDNPALAEVIGHMRRFRRANTVLTKIEALKARITEEDILPLEMLYCGAPHTRRFSCKGFNLQNLDREPLVTNPVAVKAGSPPETVWSRRWIKPRPGNVFWIADFAQVEPRVLNWLVQNEAMMQALRNGFSFYEAYVRAARQEKRVGWSGAPGTLKKEVGLAAYVKIKNESLGCGFGMGAAKYTSYADVSTEEAEAVIKGYRASNPKVVSFWRRLDSIIASAARDKQKQMVIDLPNGETLQYFNVRAAKNGYEGFVTKGDHGYQSLQPRLWGGTLTENVTQRTARDILVDAILRLEEAGLPVVFSVHDEIVLEISNDSSKDQAAAEATRILMTPPEWCADLPLGIEGGFADSYTK